MEKENLFFIVIQRKTNDFWIAAGYNKKGDISNIKFFDHRISDYYSMDKLEEDFSDFLTGIDGSYQVLCPIDCKDEVKSFTSSFESFKSKFKNEIETVEVQSNLTKPICKAAEYFCMSKKERPLALSN